MPTRYKVALQGAAATFTTLKVTGGVPGAGKVLTSDADGDATWETVSGTGDVVGPASSTDNGIARFDSTTGKLLQNSGVTIDDNNNVYTNNYFANITSTVSAAGTTVLTIASAKTQRLTGSSSQTYQLPNATTLPISSIFEFDNNSSSSLIITNAGAATQYTVPAGGDVIAKCTDNTTSNGVWDFHAMAPASATWSSGATGLVMNSVLTTTPSIGSGASSSTAPSFIPQRGASTTGFGGDGTNLYATIAGTARATISAAGITATNLSGTNTGDQTIANTSDATSHTATLSASGGSIKLVEGSGITLTTTGTGLDGIVTIASTASGSGDVVGPASATDNAIARYDSTTGKLIQNSGATIDDNSILFANGVNDGMIVHSTASTDYTLLSSSIPVIVCTQSSGTGINVILPSTGLVVGQKYFIFNKSSVSVIAKTSGANTLRTLASGEGIEARCITPGSASSSSAWVFAMLPTASFIVPTGTNTGDQTSIVGITGTLAQFNTACTDADFARTDAANTFTGVQTMTAPVMSTPVINGLATGTGVSSSSTASTIVTRDANKNIFINNSIGDYTTTATAAGTTTLTVGSTFQQFFTGSTTQTVTLPVTSTLTLGHTFFIVNNSTGAVTINSSGANAVIILAAGTYAEVTCILTSGTTAASWNVEYHASVVTTAKKLSVSNTLTLAGTDGTTMTFPSTSATIARTDAANTFTGVQTMTSPVINTGLELGNASDTTLTRVSAGKIAVEGVNVGNEGIVQNSQSAAYTLVLEDAGKHIYHPSADTTARIWTIPANGSVAFPIGTAITFINDTSAGTLTIAITTDTLVLAGAGTTGSRTLTANGVATAIKVTSTRWIISGTSNLS